MSHRSRLGAAYIDVPHDTYPRDVAFWSDALHRTPEVDPEDPDYSSFGTTGGAVELGVQSVGNPAPRVHLDIEADDIEAEVARLVTLGATEIERIHTWVVMNDPVGTVFCVIRVQDPERFNADAKRWD
jgi:predicted enzyme related to lactoylglutathione lyase